MIWPFCLTCESRECSINSLAKVCLACCEVNKNTEKKHRRNKERRQQNVAEQKSAEKKSAEISCRQTEERRNNLSPKKERRTKLSPNTVVAETNGAEQSCRRKNSAEKKVAEQVSRRKTMVPKIVMMPKSSDTRTGCLSRNKHAFFHALLGFNRPKSLRVRVRRLGLGVSV